MTAATESPQTPDEPADAKAGGSGRNVQMDPTYVTDALDRAQKAFEAMVSLDSDSATRSTAIWSYTFHVSVAVLHECFAHVMPERARQAVEWLESALEDDTAAQWVHEARAALARGERVPLPFDETERSGVSS